MTHKLSTHDGFLLLQAR